jgi:plasmid stabilization system protein ParE
MRIRFTASARDDFLERIAYIADDSPQAARGLKDRCLTALDRLERFPESGRRIPEFPDLPHRELLVGTYRFFYRVKGKTIWIVAVWHDAQIPESPVG